MTESWRAGYLPSHWDRSRRDLLKPVQQIPFIEAVLRKPVGNRPRSCPDDASLLTWLAQEKVEKGKKGPSWFQVARVYFPAIKNRVAAISKARRAYENVERFLHPTEKERRREWLDSKIKELFLCSPREFKDYLDEF